MTQPEPMNPFEYDARMDNAVSIMHGISNLLPTVIEDFWKHGIISWDPSGLVREGRSFVSIMYDDTVLWQGPVETIVDKLDVHIKGARDKEYVPKLTWEQFALILDVDLPKEE